MTLIESAIALKREWRCNAEDLTEEKRSYFLAVGRNRDDSR